MIQSIPIFDGTNLFRIPLPEAVGSSVRFSYFLHLYLAFMFFGENAKEHSKSKNAPS